MGSCLRWVWEGGFGLNRKDQEWMCNSPRAQHPVQLEQQRATVLRQEGAVVTKGWKWTGRIAWAELRDTDRAELCVGGGEGGEDQGYRCWPRNSDRMICQHRCPPKWGLVSLPAPPSPCCGAETALINLRCSTA